MSFDEKRAWIYAAIAAVVPAVYFALVLSRLATTQAGDVAYVQPMLLAVGAAIVLNIVLGVGAVAASPQDRGRTDERDASIHRHGEYRAGLVLGIAMVVPFALTLLRADHFWIAQTMYLAFVLAALTGAVLKILAYRRGY